MPHSPQTFSDLCLLYSDFNRPALLRAIRDYFIDSAIPPELQSLRRAIRDRAKSLRSSSHEGRPRAEHDPSWIRLSALLAWQREILHWTWPRIARAAGLKPGKHNLCTLQHRLDRYALLVWKALPPAASGKDA